MDGQLSFATLYYAGKNKRTKRDMFRSRDGGDGAGVSAGGGDRTPLSPAGSSGGRRAFPIAVMLRHRLPAAVVQILSDPGAEEALYHIQSMSASALWNWVDDLFLIETTIFVFRHPAESTMGS